MKNKLLSSKIILIFLVLPILFYSCKNKQKKQAKQLVWEENFDYTGLPDTTKWSYDTAGNAWGWGNNEAQYYTYADSANCYVKDGLLHITAKMDSTTKKITSARLISKEKGDWLYGKIEIKAQIPTGRGTWPAIWMLPTKWAYGNWPNSGEIDIMEHVGYEPDSIYGTVHTESYNHILGTQKSNAIKINAENKFHVYSIDWDSSKIDFFVDTLKYFTFKNEHKTSKEWPFDKKFHLLLNLAIGGNWGGKMGIDSSIFPVEMKVDYVKVYQ